MKRTRRAQFDQPAQPAPPAPGVEAPDEEGAAPLTPDLSGWTAHPSERRGFFNRIRAFPPDVAAWRRRMLEHVASESARYPAAAGLRGEPLSAALDSGISYLREVARILAILYRTPDLGNKADPTDELVYILLARHTREGAYQEAFAALRRRFKTWDELLDAPRAEVERLVRAAQRQGLAVGGPGAAAGLAAGPGPPCPCGTRPGPAMPGVRPRQDRPSWLILEALPVTPRRALTTSSARPTPGVRATALGASG
jgi:hypothetical protein